MKQEYPGDIRPLMQSCALSAQRRHQDLDRISHDVIVLKKSLAETLEKFATEHLARSAAVLSMRESTRRKLAHGQKQRSLELGRFRSKLAHERQLASSSMSKSLNAFRSELSAAVASIKSKTKVAKSMRFRSGSFSVARPMQPLTEKRAAAKDATRPGKKSEASASVYDASKRGGSRNFLDLIEY